MKMLSKKDANTSTSKILRANGNPGSTKQATKDIIIKIFQAVDAQQGVSSSDKKTIKNNILTAFNKVLKFLQGVDIDMKAMKDNIFAIFNLFQ